MNFIWNLPLFTIVLSLFSGPLCTMLKAKAAKYYTLFLECSLIFMTTLVFWYTLHTRKAFTYSMGEFPAPWGNEIRAGTLEALIALLFLVVLLCSNLAGWHFLKIDIDESKINLYYSLLNLLTAALMALVWTNDIFTGYVFLEILTLTSCGILIVREIGRTTLAAVRYMILNLLGSGLYLLGVVLLYNLTGQLLMVPMQETLAVITENGAGMPAVSLSIGILTIGLGIKSGLFPFHFWMPDTYGWATPTSASVLSSLVSKAYIFLLIKVYYRAIGIGVIARTPILKILFVLGICGIIFGSVSAIRANNIDRMVAFSSAAQIGYIYMGIGMGSTAALTAALFQIMTHAVTKSLLFLTTPYLAEVSGDSLLFKRLQGSGHRNRMAGFFFTIGALSMVGIPVFGGFSMKLLFAQSAVLETSVRKMMMVMLALAVSSLLNALYFIRTLVRIFTEPSQETEKASAAAGPEDGAVEGAKAAAAEKESVPGTARQEEMEIERLSYGTAGMILTAANVVLGLFSWVVVDLISRGLSMFS